MKATVDLCEAVDALIVEGDACCRFSAGRKKARCGSCKTKASSQASLFRNNNKNTQIPKTKTSLPG